MARDRLNACLIPVLIPRALHCAALFASCRAGVAALEFALLAPMLILGLIAMTDVGLAVNERMLMDQTLRISAQSALLDQGPVALYATLLTTSEANFPLILRGAIGTTTTLAIDASRFCACPQNTGLPVLCSFTCPSSRPTQVYYLLTASKSHKGMLMPTSVLTARLLVQSR